MSDATSKIMAALAEPIPYKWRLKSVTNKARKPYPAGTRGQFLAYIDARDVFNRLDAVLGLPNWQSEIRQINDDGSALARVSINVNGQWIVREDIGYPNNPGAGIEEEPLKAAASDAIKRAAVHFGIGRFLYELPATWVDVDANGNPTRPLPNVAPADLEKAAAARRFEAGARQEFELATDVDEKIAAGAAAVVAGHVAATFEGRGQNAQNGAPRAENGHAAQPQGQPANAPQNGQSGAHGVPCEVDGCQGACKSDWVDYSRRQYGAVLCQRHSAQAKRGELPGFGDRANEPRPQGQPQPAANPAPRPGVAPLSDKQQSLIFKIAAEKGVDANATATALYGVPVGNLGKWDASKLIDHMQALPAADGSPVLTVTASGKPTGTTSRTGAEIQAWAKTCDDLIAAAVAMNEAAPIEELMAKAGDDDAKWAVAIQRAPATWVLEVMAHEALERNLFAGRIEREIHGRATALEALGGEVPF